ncbi:hypothetical protein GQ53DRAFT_451929 [Thozetella sp. PMI_491]|nr:hypothetical protein GQ53DRAFT_451929 [Thozetella sp. PMI_491]
MAKEDSTRAAKSHQSAPLFLYPPSSASCSGTLSCGRVRIHPVLGRVPRPGGLGSIKVRDPGRPNFPDRSSVLPIDATGQVVRPCFCIFSGKQSCINICCRHYRLVLCMRRSNLVLVAAGTCPTSELHLRARLEPETPSSVL